MNAATVEPGKPGSARRGDSPEPEHDIKVDPTLGILGVLLEPTTVITKPLE